MGQAMPKQNFVFKISRTFDAPRERVWKAWTDPEQVKQWFGPKGAKMLFNEIDLRPGGASRYGMEFAENKMFGQWVYKEIKAPEKIVAIVSFLDEDGNIIAHPMAPTWPLKVYSVVTFHDAGGGKTRIDVEWSAYEARDIERKTFEEGMAGMEQGWSGSFDQLAEYLASNK
jgi:uncharacterized protein YndB with AHSA1/START domain